VANDDDKGTPEFWCGIKPGDIISLSDERTIKDKMTVGKGIGPDEMPVESVMAIAICNPKGQKMADYAMLGLGGGRSLVAKLVDRAIGLTLYGEVPDWEPATRKDLLEQDCTFLWEPPPEGDWNAGDLRYIEIINHDSSGVSYNIKAQGELTGKATYRPEKGGANEHLATIAEYVAADKDCPDPEMAVLEVGDPGNGLIRLLLGRPISINDVGATRG
jgi:hypothetical protein